MKSFFNNSSILITGGTGSFGNKFLELVIKKKLKVKRLVIFSRDELKQSEMEKKFPLKKYPFLRFFIGDIRDLDRLKRAFQGIDYIIHAAALKQVPAAEYNPTEFIKTNIIGSQNIIEAAIDKGVKKVIALSTDKAAAPINLYGATKLCADKLFVAANNYAGLKSLIFSIVRYGNVLGSRGSIVPYFLKTAKQNYLNITDKRMTRFNITLNDAVEMVFFTLINSIGGEIFVPKIPSYKIIELAKSIGPKCKLNYIGIRPGEKIHEEMITQTDSLNAAEFKNYYVILPDSKYIVWNRKKYLDKDRSDMGKMCKKNFSYNSKDNKKKLSVSDLRKILDKNFFSEKDKL